MVDKQLTGWKDLRDDELLKRYEEIRKVGKREDLPQRIDDKALGTYCRNNDCALMTADIKVYTQFLEGDIAAVQIRRYGRNKESDQSVFIIEIVRDSASTSGDDSGPE